jgi:hypothetical protein
VSLSRRPPARHWILIGLVWLVSAGGSSGQNAPRVFPVDPPDRAVVGSRPVFQIGYAGIDERALRRARFRIALSNDRFRSEAYVFDQRSRRSGWAGGAEGRAVYFPRRPIADGAYEWRAWYWNGVEWIGDGATFRLRIDTIPPAEVEDLSLSLDPDRATLSLRWSPVAVDQQGATEYVARYRVYRYTTPPFVRIPAHEVGVSESERFTLAPREVGEERLIYIVVAAEDEAGNLTGDPRRAGP